MICDNTLLTGLAVGVKPVGSNLVLEVCRDFRLPQFKLTELKPAPQPSNGNGATADVPSVPTAEPLLRRPDEGMFSHYTKKKRFSFFG